LDDEQDYRAGVAVCIEATKRNNVKVQTSLSTDRGRFPTPWIVAFIEGFSTLAVEVIAIRLAIPVVGSSVTLTGVMLGVVLFALSAGYWRGGELSARWNKAQTRTALARNLILAAVMYGALAFPLEATLLEKLLDTGLSLPMAIGVTATLLFLIPIYLASQTVPMLAELINIDGKAGKASGKVLFYSTLGSVAGGIVTPVWLFPYIGVARSTYVVCGLLAGIGAVMAIGQFRFVKALGVGAAALAAMMLTRALAEPGNSVFSFDSAYQSIRVVEEKTEGGRIERTLMMGGGRASGIYADNGETSFEYVRAAEQALAETKAETVLVIGAAGFTFPRDAANSTGVRRVDAVDVDPVVRDIAERNFLKQRLPSKVRFLPLSARYAVRKLRNDGEHYGFALVDAYFGKGIPDELVTVEFFKDLQLVSERTAVNVQTDAAIDSAFAKNVLASFREAFGAVWVKDVRSKREDSDLVNILVTSWPASGSVAWNGIGDVYRDDRNTADRDHVYLVWSF
jgi:predicted membrane-bound spermidine synthase